jgi:selenocysteine-specific elongation factor
VEALEQTFLQAQYQPPSSEEALTSHQLTHHNDRALLQVLVDQQKLVRLKGDLFYHPAVLVDVEQRLRTYLEHSGEISAGEFRETRSRWGHAMVSGTRHV